MIQITGLTAFQTYLSEKRNASRGQLFSQDIEDSVKQILEEVRLKGDQAIKTFNQRFDGLSPEVPLLVSPDEIAAARLQVEPEFIAAIETAIQNIRQFHQVQTNKGFQMMTENGSLLGSVVTPLDRVAVYVPGGKAAYPSSVVMNIVPAQLAGVKEIYVLTPPSRDGSLNPHVAVTADLLGVTQIYRAGGAQGVAAAAFGTETIPRADKIVGPGNAYVAAAKRAVFGLIDIDMIAGPSEIAVIADDSANPAWVAADLLSQAEHDEMASCFLLTDSPTLLTAVQAEIEKQTAQLPRREIILTSLAQHGCLVLTDSLTEACEAANLIAPEHLEINTAKPYELQPLIRHAGAIFLGAFSTEPIGDYIAGPNHVLPTGGTAAFASPLSVTDFQKHSSLICYTQADFQQFGPQAIQIAEAEGLFAHANAMKVRLKP